MNKADNRLKVVSRVKSTVAKHHFNAQNVDYGSWFKEVDEKLPLLLEADDEGFETAIRILLTKLKSSHTNFYRANTQPLLPQHVIGATLRSICRDGSSRWMFQDVFENSPAARAGITPGYFLRSVNGTLIVPPDLPRFSFGEKYQIDIKRYGQRNGTTVEVLIPFYKTRGRRPPMFEPRDIVPRTFQSIGILRIPFFSGAFGIRFSEQLAATMECLNAQGCDRLIIDLRGCLGGSLGFASLVSYLCPDQVPIGYDITRKRLQQGYRVSDLPRVSMPRTVVGLLFSLVRFSVQDKSLILLTQGLGKQPFHGRVVMLVNEFTNSAGEMAAQFAKESKLAVIVGHRTGGRVLGSTAFSVGSGYSLYLPVFGWYSAAGNSIENSGVEPDIAIDIDPEKLALGDDAQENKAIEILK